METTPPPTRRPRRLSRILGIATVLAVIGIAGAVAASEPVGAATQGAGFGTWAPISTYGWHGSMRVGDVHTYCITPGAPAPTGPTDDHGISGDAAGLSPAALTGINLLVTKYGQTEDPVQAASVGWAVKAIANWNETLHAFGYPGDDLRGAINWTFSALAPAQNQAVQDLASAYYTEATHVAAGPGGGHGSVAVTIDPDDPLGGTVRVDAEPTDARGELSLERAVFADSESARRTDVRPGETYEIRATPPEDGSAFKVSASGTFHSRYRAAVRHFRTAGGQDTAGPASGEFTVTGEDAVARDIAFEPTITTKVVSRYVDGGAFEDEVTFRVKGAWPRISKGGYLPIAAHATIYRTDTEPAKESKAPPEGAKVVGTMSLTSDTATGPTVPYLVKSTEALPGPGVYTAVWTITAKGQRDDIVKHLPENYAWTEPFGEQTQIILVPDITTRAQETGTVGGSAIDTIIVSGPVPARGLSITAALYRALEEEPSKSCTKERLVWHSADKPIHVTTPGEYVVTAPAIPDFGAFFWQETARDAEGKIVHVGECGIANETTRALLPSVTTLAMPEVGFGEDATDTATVSGQVPTSGRTTLTFALYRATDGEAATCTEDTLIADTSDSPVDVVQAGDYTSPPVRLERTGAHHWIETLWWQPTPDAERRVLDRGECGAEGETTRVETPAVMTRALERVATGDPYTDTATVTGLGPDTEATLMFFLYRGAHGETPTCTAETLETTTAPVPVIGDGEYASPPVTSAEAGVRHWIAQLQYTDSSGRSIVLHRGECGEENETTFVDVLAVTGRGDGPPLPLLGGAAALTVGLGAVMILVRRRSGRMSA